MSYLGLRWPTPWDATVGTGAPPVTDRRVTVQVRELTVAARQAPLLENVSFDCGEGEWTLVYGPTGSGKSTLLRALNGLRVPARGCAWVLGTRIPGRSGREARAVWRRTGTVLQEIALFETKTAAENVGLALRTVGVDGRSARDEARHWLARLHLEEKLDEYPARLSGGERQRVALARAFAVRPRLLLLDEPTSALDRATAQLVLAAIAELVAEGTTAVMSSHRLDEVAELCHQRVGLRNGHLVHVERHRGGAWAEHSAASNGASNGVVLIGTLRKEGR